MTEKLVVPLLLLAVGALLGGVVNAMTARYAAFTEAKGIAAALRAEVDSILSLVERRAYVQHLTGIIARLHEADHVVTSNDVPSIAVTQDYFSVFHATAAKIGLLGELGAPITRLYVLGKGLIEDLRTLREWHEKRVLITREGLIDALQQVRAQIETIQDEGRALVVRLDAFASPRRRWLRLFP